MLAVVLVMKSAETLGDAVLAQLAAKQDRIWQAHSPICLIPPR